MAGALAAVFGLHAAELAGHRLLVTSVWTGDTEVFIASPATGDMLNVSRSPASEDRYPGWSSDGEKTAFVSDREGAANFRLMDADGGNVRRLIATPAVWYMPSWQVTPAGLARARVNSR